MLNEYPNIFKGERLVEVCFVVETMERFSAENPNGYSDLDV